jgi:hypothetical protein
MIILLIVVAWGLLLVLIVGLCVTARLGDRYPQRSAVVPSSPAPTHESASGAARHEWRTPRRRAATFTR